MMRKVALAVLLVTLLASGCSKVDADSQAPSVTTSVDPSTAADASPTPDPGASPSEQPSAAPSKKTVTYPATAKAYGSALLSAWGAKNTARAAQLAGSAALLQLRDPQSQDKTTWSAVSCDASGDSTACLFRNGYGDNITLTMTTADLGRPTAVTDALVERTTYPDERTAYATEFVAAWQAGNSARMTRLANSTVADYFKSKPPFTNLTTLDKGTKVQISPASAGGGSGTYDLEFDSGRLGSAHSITSASPAT